MRILGQGIPEKREESSKPELVLERFQKELSQWQNEGYPFAKIDVDSIDYPRQAIILAILDPGPRMLNGELVVHGDSSLKPKVLRNWLRFRKSNPFSSDQFARIPYLSSHIPFAEEVKTPDLEWFGNQAVVHLYLKKRRNNSFSGILGILPQPSGGGAILTGNIDGSLSNLFGQGIGMNFKWSRFAASSQTAQLSLLAPALTSAGLGTEGNFELFRQDSLLSKQKADLQGIFTSPYLIQVRFGFSGSSASGRMADADKNLLSVSTQALLLGLRFDPDPANEIRIKRKSFILQILPSIKTVKRADGSRTIPNLEFRSTGFYPILVKGKRFCLQSSWDLGILVSKEITLPDQFRMGGSRSIRGFNENNFFTTQHGLISFQPQFQLDKNLLAGIFADVMVFNPDRTPGFFDNPVLAAGFGIQTELGIGNNLVRISLANGFTKDLPFDYQTTKIHFGYVARF
jgi:outer membrane protein assembly factor BamA